jgi:hypothetical protein
VTNSAQKAGPKQGTLNEVQNPGPAPAEEMARIALDLVRVGKSDIEAESENEAPDGSERNGTTNVAEQMKLHRVSKADATDQRLLSKHLPATIDEFLPNTVPFPQPGSCKQQKR